MTKISLYYRQGSSDKEYHASIEPKDGGYVVNFAFGRRGSTLQTGTKTSTPVDLQIATDLFERLVRGKKAKGYSEGQAGTPYQHTAQEQRVTRIQCQLLNAVEESDLEKLIADERWCAQEKIDGRRVLIQRRGDKVIGINRNGLAIGLSVTLIQTAQSHETDFLMDGECVGERFFAFDVLSLDGEDTRMLPYSQRLMVLKKILGSGPGNRILPTLTAISTEEKTQLLWSLRQQGKEGIVFKRLDAPYVAGRPNTGGTQLKHKFYATVSAIVAGVHRKRSVALTLFDGHAPVSVGSVTIPPNQQIPEVGEVVEVRYLYAFRQSRSLFQPVYLGPRTDVLPSGCTLAQLKFKNGEEEV